MNTYNVEYRVDLGDRGNGYETLAYRHEVAADSVDAACRKVDAVVEYKHCRYEWQDTRVRIIQDSIREVPPL